MGLVFAVVVLLVGRAAMREERDEIAQAFRTVAGLRKARFSMKELGEAGPALRARVTDREGHRIASRGRMPDPPDDLDRGFATRGRWLFFAGRYGTERVVVARDLSEVERGQTELGEILAALWLPLSLLVGGATWIAALSVFRPLDRLAEAVACIEGADLAKRLPAPDRAEFGALATVLNRMLGRIEESARRSEQFADDAAHEMRTPLAAMRAQIETTLLRLPHGRLSTSQSDRTVLDGGGKALGPWSMPSCVRHGDRGTSGRGSSSDRSCGRPEMRAAIPALRMRDRRGMGPHDARRGLRDRR